VCRMCVCVWACVYVVRGQCGCLEQGPRLCACAGCWVVAVVCHTVGCACVGTNGLPCSVAGAAAADSLLEWTRGCACYADAVTLGGCHCTLCEQHCRWYAAVAGCSKSGTTAGRSPHPVKGLLMCGQRIVARRLPLHGGQSHAGAVPGPARAYCPAESARDDSWQHCAKPSHS
jgi:hypothetical protein